MAPLIFAHRGGDDGRPNSVAAVRAAAGRGVDGVEIDIQLDDEGRLIARHDLGPSSGAFDELDDMLAVVQEHDLHLLIDFKSAGGRSVQAEADALIATLLATDGRAKVSVSSFSVPFLERVAEQSDDFDLYPIVSLRQNFIGLGSLERWAGVSVLAAAALVHPRLLWRVRSARCRLAVWFGSTEWRPVIWGARKLGAHALIVHHVAPSRLS